MLEILLEFFGGKFLKAIFDRRKLQLLVHQAHFEDDKEECFFINLTNVSRDRDIEITHIWFESDSQIHVMREDRKLPKRLKPDETWETWLPVNQLQENFRTQAFTLVRARLSTGSIVSSKKNINVPKRGEVPGGPIERKKLII